MCISKNKPSNVTKHNLFVIEGLFVWPKACDCVYVDWCWHKRSQSKSSLTQSQALTVKLSQQQSPHQ